MNRSGAAMLWTIQKTMTIVWKTRNRAVPRKLAIDSLNAPKTSESYWTPSLRRERGEVRSSWRFT